MRAPTALARPCEAVTATPGGGTALSHRAAYRGGWRGHDGTSAMLPSSEGIGSEGEGGRWPLTPSGWPLPGVATSVT